MCRLFGFKSVFQSQVNHSLIHAENALNAQSVKHPDGWGVGYYIQGAPHIIKSPEAAFDDHIFQTVSGVVRSKTVLAHIRKATQGSLNILNAHPFQFGRWIFAHNGNLKNFSAYKKDLRNLIDADLRPYILGTTDSEMIFFVILSSLKNTFGSLDFSQIDTDLFALAIENAINSICKLSGELYNKPDQDPKENHITFILTNGEILCSLQAGQSIFFSTHKSQCPERNTCKFYNNSCESSSNSGQEINHLIISSEKMQGENIWTPMNNGQFILIDSQMIFKTKNLNLPFSKN